MSVTGFTGVTDYVFRDVLCIFLSSSNIVFTSCCSTFCVLLCLVIQHLADVDQLWCVLLHEAHLQLLRCVVLGEDGLQALPLLEPCLRYLKMRLMLILALRDIFTLNILNLVASRIVQLYSTPTGTIRLYLANRYFLEFYLGTRKLIINWWQFSDFRAITVEPIASYHSHSQPGKCKKEFTNVNGRFLAFPSQLLIQTFL